MSDCNFQREDMNYSPFYFDLESITPSQYLYLMQINDMEMYQQYMEEYES